VLTAGASGLVRESSALIDHLRAIGKRRIRLVFGQVSAAELTDRSGIGTVSRCADDAVGLEAALDESRECTMATRPIHLGEHLEEELPELGMRAAEVSRDSTGRPVQLSSLYDVRRPSRGDPLGRSSAKAWIETD